MIEIETDSLVTHHSISLYLDYPEELLIAYDKSKRSESGVVDVIKEVVESVTALLVESHLTSIPIFSDRLDELVAGVTDKTIEDGGFMLDTTHVVSVLSTLVKDMSGFIRPIVQGYLPPSPELFITTMVDVLCCVDYLVVTIHY